MMTLPPSVLDQLQSDIAQFKPAKPTKPSLLAYIEPLAEDLQRARSAPVPASFSELARHVYATLKPILPWTTQRQVYDTIRRLCASPAPRASRGSRRTSAAPKPAAEPSLVESESAPIITEQGTSAKTTLADTIRASIADSDPNPNRIPPPPPAARPRTINREDLL